MYQNATINKTVSSLITAINAYKALNNPELIKVCISKGNQKIGRVMNFSLAPVITCGHACAHCKGYCYDIKACNQYPNTVVDARARNTALLQMDRDLLFSRIDDTMNRRRANKFFRWHVAGDIIDLDYFSRMVENARKHPDFIIWTYTKQYSIVNAYCEKYGRDFIPSNFTVMFSEWRGLPMVNPFGFPEFRVVMKDDATKPDPATNFYCPGNCDICKHAHCGCIAGKTVYCNEH